MKIHRIYKVDTMLVGPKFPQVFVLCSVLERIGVGIIAPIKRGGKVAGKRLAMDLEVIRAHYSLMNVRDADQLISRATIPAWVRAKGTQ